MNDTITTYTRRNRRGIKETTVKTDTWFASVLDFASTDKREWGFTTVDVHCNRLNSDPAEIRDGEVPVFWACGDTALLAASRAKVDFMLSYVDAGVLVTDIPVEQVGDLYRRIVPELPSLLRGRRLGLC